MNESPSVITTGALVLGVALATPAAAEGFRDLHDPGLEPTYQTYDIDAAWPDFAVDHRWPKPLPNQWLIGQVGGLAVDRHDNIWIIQRARSLTSDEAGATDAYVDPDTGETATNADGVPVDGNGFARPFGPIAECCLPAPAVMQFDKEGNLLQAWGGPADEGYLGSSKCREEDGCTWPAGEHGIYVDHNDFVYISGNGNGTGGTPWAATHGWDSQVLKFSKDGTFLLNIGDPGSPAADSNDTDGALNGTPQVWRAADMEVDPKTNELYIADGYGNHRVLVVDARTGLYKRHWGAYGANPVDDAAADAVGPYAEDRDAGIIPQYFRNPVHCVRITHDRKVYVCDRVNNRIQVFKTDGTFIEEAFIRQDTLLNGSVWDLDTSSDRKQSCLYNPDGSNQYVDTLLRESLELIATFGRNGRSAGQFHWVHNLAVDSHGNIYTAEVDTGKRAQKFVRSGVDGCWLK
jgi:DNA-binding beta-propeller fold protein YncE